MNRHHLAYLLLALTTLFWAANLVVARAYSVDMPPATLAFIRWSIAALIFVPFGIAGVIRQRSVIKENWNILVFLGLMSVVAFNILIYTGLQYTTALNSSLLQSAMPIIILLLCSLFLKEHSSPRQWLGVVVSLCGVLFLLTAGEPEKLLTLQLNEGDVWICVAMVAWATYSIALRWRPHELSAVAFLTVMMLVGVTALAPLSWFEMLRYPPIEWDYGLGLALFYLALFPSILAYLFWNFGVHQLGVQKAGLFIHLIPFWGMLLSVLFLGEQVHSFHLWGISLIFIGIYLAVVRSNRTSADESK